MVEHSTENAGVAGSIPALGAKAARSRPSGSSSVVEHFLAKEEVAGSNPVSRSTSATRSRLQMSTSGCGAVGSARRSGRRGRWFKSSHPDHPPPSLSARKCAPTTRPSMRPPSPPQDDSSGSLHSTRPHPSRRSQISVPLGHERDAPSILPLMWVIPTFLSFFRCARVTDATPAADY